MVSMQAQFFGGLKQKIIPVKDFSRESFKLFLHVLEGQRIHRPSMKFSSWFDLLCLADKYLVPGLEQFVVEQMMNNLRKQVGLDPVLEVIFHLADTSSLAWKVSEDLLYQRAWPFSELSFDQWRTQIALGCNSEEVVEVRRSFDLREQLNQLKFVQPLLMQTLDAVQQLFELISRKIGDANEVDVLAEDLFQTIIQQTQALRESLEAFSEQKNGPEKRFWCMNCHLPLVSLETVLEHKHPLTEWIVPVPT